MPECIVGNKLFAIANNHSKESPNEVRSWSASFACCLGVWSPHGDRQQEMSEVYLQC